jgi:hypothetical protein
MDSFSFDGGQITAKRLRRQITVYSEGALQTALESGCQSVPAVMAFLALRDMGAQARMQAAGRKGARTTDALIKKFGSAR